MNADTKIPDISSAGISDAISKLMEHPELISMVASALSGNSPQEPQSAAASEEESAESAETSAESSPPHDAISSVMPMISKLSSISEKGGGIDKKHEQLLCALKLYVSPARRDAIDYILKFSQMSSLFKALK